MNTSKGYSIVPTVILEDNNITDKQLRLYIKISSLCASTGECWASDSYFAEIFSTNKSTISKNISQLYKKEYIGKTVIYKNGTKKIEKRIITLTPSIEEILDVGYSKKETEGTVNNGGDNSIKVNNIKLITDEVYTYYVNKTNIDKKFLYPTKAKAKISSALKLHNKEAILLSIDTYFKTVDKKWRITPVKFFNLKSELELIMQII